MSESKKLKVAAALAKKRDGRNVQAVDFMDMNKTMINFNSRQESLVSKFDHSVAEEAKEVTGADIQRRRSIPKHKVGGSGAFRHTEYAKGFYKVKGQATQETFETRKTSYGDKNTTGFSEAERSNVLDNKTRQPLARNIFGRGGGKSIPTQQRNASGMPYLTVESDTSRFNSTTDTFFTKQQTQKLNMKSLSPG
jgi:ribosomal protein S13